MVSFVIKFRTDRCLFSEILQFYRFWQFGLTPHCGGVSGTFPANDVTYHFNPNEDRPWAEPRHLSRKA